MGSINGRNQPFSRALKNARPRVAALLSLLFSGRHGRRIIVSVCHDDGAVINP
jgi:hypothetical protein